MYYSVKELANAAQKHIPPWVILCTQTDYVALGLVDAQSDVAVKVVFDDTFTPIISRKGTL